MQHLIFHPLNEASAFSLGFLKRVYSHLQLNMWQKYTINQRIIRRMRASCLYFIQWFVVSWYRQSVRERGGGNKKSLSGASKCIYCQVCFPEQPSGVPHLHAPSRQSSSAGCGHHTGTDVTPGLCDLCCWGDLLVSKQHASLLQMQEHVCVCEHKKGWCAFVCTFLRMHTWYWWTMTQSQREMCAATLDTNSVSHFFLIPLKPL